MEAKNKNDVQAEEGTQERLVKNGKSKRKPVTCIDKALFDEPPKSDYVLMQIFYTVLHSTFIVLSKLRLGQIMISILDYYMVKIENTLDFCCPNNFEFADQEVIEKHKHLSVHDRPMAWIFFIPALVLLRVFRFTLSVFCIVTGRGEVTAQQMQAKVIAFRRYYRSIRHYAIDKWTDDDKKLIEERKSGQFWRIYYRVYETIFMTKPRIEHHYNYDDEEEDNKEEAQKEQKKAKSGEKKRLNASQSSSDDDSDAELNGMQLLDKYGDLNSSADPDYKPDDTSNMNSTIDSTLGTDEERDKTESQQELNDLESHDINTYSSDVERSETDKSSPPEKAYKSDSEVTNNQHL